MLRTEIKHKSRPNPVHVILAEAHSICAAMRLNTRWASTGQVVTINHNSCFFFFFLHVDCMILAFVSASFRCCSILVSGLWLFSRLKLHADLNHLRC